MKPKFAMIFDMDGVLINSAHTAYRVRSRLLAGHGIDLNQVPDPHNESHKAASMRDLLAAVHSHTGIEIDQAEFSKASVSAMYEALRSEQAEPGLLALLESLRTQGVPLAIASGGRSESVQKKLEILGIANYFKVIVTASDVANHKPHPEPYLEAARGLEIAPERCVAIEDSVAGVIAGKAAGCTVIGLTLHNESNRPVPGADIKVATWSELSYGRLTDIMQVKDF